MGEPRPGDKDRPMGPWREQVKLTAKVFLEWQHKTIHESPMLWTALGIDVDAVCHAVGCETPIAVPEEEKMEFESVIPADVPRYMQMVGLRLPKTLGQRPGPDERPDLYYNDPGEDGAPMWRGHPIGPLAFPRPGHGVVVDDIDFTQEGMLLMDWFAGQIAAAEYGSHRGSGDPDRTARFAYDAAEALIKERQRRIYGNRE